MVGGSNDLGRAYRLSPTTHHLPPTTFTGSNYARDSEQVTRLTALTFRGEYLSESGCGRAMALGPGKGAASKSCVDAVLPEMSMRQTESFEHRTSRPMELSTRTRLFSTRRQPALHVRDVDFVRLFHICTYRGTGVDSRVALPSAPAMPLLIGPASSTVVPRPAQRSTRLASRRSSLFTV